jgi:hypothetical protein
MTGIDDAVGEDDNGQPGLDWVLVDGGAGVPVESDRTRCTVVPLERAVAADEVGSGAVACHENRLVREIDGDDIERRRDAAMSVGVQKVMRGAGARSIPNALLQQRDGLAGDHHAERLCGVS